MPWWMLASIIVLCVIGVAMIIWRKEITSLQAMTFGAKLHPGCAVVEGALLLLLALVYFLIARTR